MTRQNEWNEFLRNLFLIALDSFKHSREYESMQDQEEELLARLSVQYPDVPHDYRDDLAFAVLLHAERMAEFTYQRGIYDASYILKELQIIS